MSVSLDRYHGYEIKINAGGRQFSRPVAPGDMASAQEQTRFEADRQGKLPNDEYEVTVNEEPEFAAGSASLITGVRMSVGQGKDAFVQRFDLSLFQPIARQHIAELIKNGQLDAKDEPHYEVFAAEIPRPESARVRRRSPPVAPAVLADYREISIPCGPHKPSDFDVFVLDDCLQQMQDMTFQRAGNEQAVWLVGRLLRDIDTEDLAVLIHTVIEAQGLQMDRFSIDLSAASYTDIDTQLARRRKRAGCEGDRKVGLMHTHPFLPSVVDGKEGCPTCSLQAECQLTSSFFSTRDAEFQRSVFGRTAYAVQFVLGLTPREERDLRLFCLDGGTFRERGYNRLPHVPTSTS